MNNQKFRTSQEFTFNTEEGGKAFIRNDTNAAKEALEYYRKACIKLYIGPSSNATNLLKSDTLEFSVDLLSLKEITIFSKLLGSFELYRHITFTGEIDRHSLNRKPIVSSRP